MNERATNSSNCFDDALLRYLSETTMRGRRRRFFRQGRWVILLLAALLTCQWPDVRSDAADAAEREAKQRTVGLAAFACPQLADLLGVPVAGTVQVCRAVAGAGLAPLAGLRLAAAARDQQFQRLVGGHHRCFTISILE